MVWRDESERWVLQTWELELVLASVPKDDSSGENPVVGSLCTRVEISGLGWIARLLLTLA
jgi:hypothetical protein